MKSRKPKTVLYRRKREGKTNYKKRLRLLLARKPRLVLRFTNQNIIAQLVSFTPQGDKVLMGVNSSSLKKLGWTYSSKNTPAAYLTGLFLGKKLLEKDYQEAILDTGFRDPLKKGKVYVFLKGILDSGVKIPSGGEEIFPDEKRLTGEHIQKEKLTEVFQQIKQKINNNK